MELRDAICSILAAHGARGVPIQTIMSTLFLAREKKPDGPLCDVGFYWFREGPYSEGVKSALDDMVADGIIRMEQGVYLH